MRSSKVRVFRLTTFRSLLLACKGLLPCAGEREMGSLAGTVGSSHGRLYIYIPITLITIKLLFIYTLIHSYYTSIYIYSFKLLLNYY